MSLDKCLADLIVEQMQPDYTAIREEIQRHPFVIMKLTRCNHWYKVLFTTDYFAIVQELELTVGHSRFKTYKIAFGDEWNTKFREWMDLDQDRYEDALNCWQRGMGMYGARV